MHFRDEEEKKSIASVFKCKKGNGFLSMCAENGEKN